MTPYLQDALRAWTGILGPEHVISDRDSLDQASVATFATAQRVLAILEPADRGEVQHCVRTANRFRIPIHPISSGKNWGYGSRVPVQDAVLLDLRRMNRIVAFNEALASVTVEPGVTQRQLHEFLHDRGSRLWMDATGASPDCSIIGNTLERGFGHTPLGDHAGHAYDLEVVLPTGEVIETGFARFGAGAVSRWGVGPALDGLFSQSNLGIVTRLTMALLPAPEYFQAFFFLSRDEHAIGSIVDALRPLRLDGTVKSVVHVANDHKVLTARGTRTGPMSVEAARRQRQALGIGAWNGSGGLYGTRAQVREARRLVRRALAGTVHRLQFVDDRLLRLMRRFARPFRLVAGWDIEHTLAVLEPAYNLLKGIPTDATLASAYCRKAPGPARHMDPDRDKCGLLWCSPVLPNEARSAAEVTSLATDHLVAHGFEPQISLSLATERMAICVITISYDRDVAGEDDRAHACYDTLTQALLSRGYPPYRLNVNAMSLVAEPGPYSDVLLAIKRVLDPHGVVAPGRYEPAASTQPATRTA